MTATLHRHDFGPAGEWRDDVLAFDRLAEIVQAYLGCEAAVVSLDAPRCPGRSRSRQSARRCGIAVRQGAEFAMPCALEPHELVDPVIAGEIGMRFYAGLPLYDRSGRTVGTLAAMDHHPRKLAAGDLDALKLLAGVASELYEQQNLPKPGAAPVSDPQG